MKKFVKNHFKFVFTLIYFTFFISSISREISSKNKSINSNITDTDHIIDIDLEHLLNRCDNLEKKLKEIETTIGISTELLFDEIRVLSAYEYICYEEVIKCFNHYHQKSDYKPIDYIKVSENIHKCYFDVKREKFNQKLKECNEKKIPMDTH